MCSLYVTYLIVDGDKVGQCRCGVRRESRVVGGQPAQVKDLMVCCVSWSHIMECSHGVMCVNGVLCGHGVVCGHGRLCGHGVMVSYSAW